MKTTLAPVVLLVLLAVCLLVARGPSAEPQTARTVPRVAVPEDDPAFKATLQKLAERANLYQRNATRGTVRARGISRLVPRTASSNPIEASY